MKKAAEDALEKAEAEKKAAEEEAARQKQIADEAQAALDKAAAEEAEQRQKEADALAAKEKAEADAKEAEAALETLKKQAAAADKINLDEDAEDIEADIDRARAFIDQMYLDIANAAGEVEEAKDAQEDADADQADAVEDAEDAQNAREEAARVAAAAQTVVDNAKLEIQIVEDLREDRSAVLACPFTFKQGVSQVVVPDGCAFFGTNDVTYLKQKRTSTPAVYFCTKSDTPLELNSADLKKYGLQSSISFIQPGGSSHVQFFSADRQKGMSSSFNSKSYKPLNSYKYKDGSSANDHVKSAVLTTQTDKIPDDCHDLSFTSKMKLNTKLMVKMFE